MIMKRLRNAGKLRLRSGVGGCVLREAPVECSRHIPRGLTVAAGVGSLQEEEWVLPGLSRQREQACSEGRPGALARGFRNDLVGSAVERVNDLKSDELLGCHLEPVSSYCSARWPTGEVAVSVAGSAAQPRAGWTPADHVARPAAELCGHPCGRALQRA